MLQPIHACLQDCDTTERVLPDAYRANIKAVLETLKPAAAAVAFTTTTPYDMPTSPAGIDMSCVLEYNTIAKEVAAEVGGVTVIDLYAHVERFCQPSAAGWPPLTPDRNYSVCAIQSKYGVDLYQAIPFSFPPFSFHHSCAPCPPCSHCLPHYNPTTLPHHNPIH